MRLSKAILSEGFNGGNGGDWRVTVAFDAVGGVLAVVVIALDVVTVALVAVAIGVDAAVTTAAVVAGLIGFSSTSAVTGYKDKLIKVNISTAKK